MKYLLILVIFLWACESAELFNQHNAYRDWDACRDRVNQIIERKGPEHLLQLWKSNEQAAWLRYLKYSDDWFKSRLTK
jgi:hypothetical protein